MTVGASYAAIRASIGAAACTAFIPIQGRAECAPGAEKRELGVDRALAARFDPPPGRLEQDRQVAGDEIRTLGEQPTQPVVLVGDFFAVVEAQRHVAARRVASVGRELQQHREPALHVGGAETVHRVAVPAGRRVAIRGHGVEVAAEHDPFRRAAVRARDHIGAEPRDFEVRGAIAQRCLDDVGQRGFVAAHRRHRAERSRSARADRPSETPDQRRHRAHAAAR